VKKKLLLLGSTGSIGTQVLEVVRLFPNKFEVVGLSAHSNIDLLLQQAEEFGVKNICITCREQSRLFCEKKEGSRAFLISTFFFEEGLIDMIYKINADIAILAVSGGNSVAMAEVILESGKNLALASKEALVCAGEEIMNLVKKTGKQILPLDSEHSAIWQCLRGKKMEDVEKIWLTCSGGPFLDAKKFPLEKLQNITPQQALKHPNWEMGKKISIDSATLMNKALEFIEAVYLFGIPPEKIEVVVHPESLVHSAVEFVDGSIIAQVGTPDMRIPLAHALFYPEISPLPFPKFSFFEKKFTFQKIDEVRFPSLQFAKKALKNGKCAQMNSANEKAVHDFLNGKICFLDIFKEVEKSIGNKE
jgi:1-deoxy-D-xylulose-5-phosphate reductoisomerase